MENPGSDFRSLYFAVLLSVLLCLSGCAKHSLRHKSTICAANMLRLEEAINEFRAKNGFYPGKLHQLQLGTLVCNTTGKDTYSSTYRVWNGGADCEFYCSHAKLSKNVGGSKKYGYYDSKTRKLGHR